MPSRIEGVLMLFVFFQHNTVVKTDLGLQQWLDLGNQSQACITIPETCGAQGGTISAWVKPLDCGSGGGIISSFLGVMSSFSILCAEPNLR